MSLNIASHKSTRLNRLNVGQRVTLCDFTKKQAVFVATVTGWKIGDKAAPAPSSMKEMPANISLNFDNVVNMQGEAQDNVTLVSAPGTYGALFLAIVTGEGENTKTTYRRVTAYETVADVEAKAATKAKVKEEKEAAKVTETVPEVTEEVTA